MFDIAWTELLLVAVVAILVVGPKELPGMLRTVGKAIGSVRRMASDFQSTLNDAVKEAEKQAGIDEMRAQADAAQNFNPLKDLKDSLESERKQIDSAVKGGATPAPQAGVAEDDPSIAPEPAVTPLGADPAMQSKKSASVVTADSSEKDT
ncbi:Sec-independent protein translocase protein TatB [Polycladidibacter hongkongensis]|uniref:Sec-independent protein translocase protein TatB n=1 Tax=Polycladidibacter hongkongensis TaxID=1647556 RepID=UPI0009E970D2|nr:Sec-independent protein translocase protein TatB [Pseudovibrio hongkongensis]